MPEPAPSAASRVASLRSAGRFEGFKLAGELGTDAELKLLSELIRDPQGNISTVLGYGKKDPMAAGAEWKNDWSAQHVLGNRVYGTLSGIVPDQKFTLEKNSLWFEERRLGEPFPEYHPTRNADGQIPNGRDIKDNQFKVMMSSEGVDYLRELFRVYRETEALIIPKPAEKPK